MYIPPLVSPSAFGSRRPGLFRRSSNPSWASTMLPAGTWFGSKRLMPTRCCMASPPLREPEFGVLDGERLAVGHGPVAREVEGPENLPGADRHVVVEAVEPAGSGSRGGQVPAGGGPDKGLRLAGGGGVRCVPGGAPP